MPRLVLDTNVWLDLLVFRDPGVAPLLDALRTGRACAVTSAATRAELGRVLAYPALALDGASRAAAMDHALALSSCFDAPPPARPLPRCSDPDDQVFIELAVAAAAQALLSRDAALLRMARRLQREGIRVTTPAEWCATASASAAVGTG